MSLADVALVYAQATLRRYYFGTAILGTRHAQ